MQAWNFKLLMISWVPATQAEATHGCAGADGFAARGSGGAADAPWSWLRARETRADEGKLLVRLGDICRDTRLCGFRGFASFAAGRGRSAVQDTAHTG